MVLQFAVSGSSFLFQHRPQLLLLVKRSFQYDLNEMSRILQEECRGIIICSTHVQVCIYFLPFLDAEEKKRYGWFWVCRICGKHCHYRYTLPPGYDPKSQMIGSCSLT
ncbi:unnamed protein product, partial [Cuscuta epithymum]